MKTFAERIVLFSIALVVSSGIACASVGGASSNEKSIENEIRKLNDDEVQVLSG